MVRKDKKPSDGTRIARVIARAGMCSRREAEMWITTGRVSVNGAVIRSPALDVKDSDRIVVDGEPLPRRERTRLFLYHKPRGLVTTNADPQGRPTIFDHMPAGLPRLITVGRLDINSEGLLLLTNDGGLARVLELPETRWLRRYRVRALGRVSQTRLDGLRSGISVDGVNYGSIEATADREQGANMWITFAIREGKNREVRNVLGALGLSVNRLIRVAYGPFELGELPEGMVEEVATRQLREAIGERIAEQAIVDLSGPASELPPQEPKDFRRVRGKDRPGEAGADGDRAEKKSRTQRHHSDTHAWRGGDAPLRRSFHGARATRRDEKPAGAGRMDHVADRKGRQVHVERFGEPKKIERDERKFGKSRDRPHGDRPRGDRPHPSRPYSDRPHGDRKRDDRKGRDDSRRDDNRGQENRGNENPGDRARRPSSSRTPRDRRTGPRPSRPKD